MLSFGRLLATISLALAASAAVSNVVPPSSKGVWNDPGNTLDLSGTTTDTSTIVSTAQVVDQKGGPDGPPNQDIPDVVVTAVDGTLTPDGTVSGTTRRRSTGISRRSPADYQLVFSGTGTGPNDRDGSIQGTAYLTFTVINNSTYNVNACLAFCDSVQLCVFANLFYEFNNPGLDQGGSNLKCAVYGDVHSAAEKTNRGGQQLAPPPAGLTYIQQSSGYAVKKLLDPPVPEGYQLVFGPTNGANNAPGYMGFAFLDRYDVDACAQLCNTRGADSNGGACQYFNIWRAVVNGNPTTYTCSMYFIVADASSATNTGQGDLKVTFSRGYKRINYVVDGGFEGYPCSIGFCFAESYANWVGTSAPGGFWDALIFNYAPYAHAGHGSGLLGSGSGSDDLPGTLTPAAPLNTHAGHHYTITFFQASAFSGQSGEANAFIDILWNGNLVTTIHPGYQDWQFYQFDVVAVGNDVLAFHGGRAPSWSFIDDVGVFIS